MTSDGEKPAAKKPRESEVQAAVRAIACDPYHRVFLRDDIAVDRAGVSVALSDLPHAKRLAERGLIRLESQAVEEN
jgi:hypothetical protein